MDLKTAGIRYYERVLTSADISEFQVRTCEVGAFRLTESKFASDYRLGKHSHEYGCFFIVLKGALTEFYGKKSREFRRLSMAFSPPEQTHSDKFHNTGGHCFMLEIAPHWLERSREHSLMLDNAADFDGGLLAWLTIRLYNESRAMDAVSPLVIESLAAEILAEVSRRTVRDAERQPPPWLKQASELLHARFAEGLTLAGIAEAVGVHPVHLARGFRRFYRCTTGEYMRQLRIEFAARELSTSETPLATIAAAAGFSDQSHFSRTFKDRTGLTPGEFRSGFRSS